MVITRDQGMLSRRALRIYINAYFFLLIFEGAVRKWIPGMSGPMLLVRDPVALVIFLAGLKNNCIRPAWKLGIAVYSIVIVSLGFIQLISAQPDVWIFLYGIRSYVLHVPVAIIIGYFYTEEDLKRLMRWLLPIGCGMSVLMILQYLSPSDSFLNKGAGEDSGQLSGVLGHIRGAGTFSFITGPTLFYPILLAFALWAWYKRLVSPLLVGLAVTAVLVAMPVSISRSLVGNCTMVFFAAMIGIPLCGGFKIQAASVFRIAVAGLVFGVLVVALSRVDLVSESIDAFMIRWDQAQGSEAGSGGIAGRIEANLIGDIDKSNLPSLGYGIGVGSQVAASLQSKDALSYGESTVDREVSELGPYLGLIFMAIRYVAAIALVIAAFRSMWRGDLLSWLLMPMAAYMIAMAALDQTTVQGFLFSVVGLTIASLRLFASTKRQEAIMRAQSRLLES